MRKEREDIFEKNSALEDAVGKLCKEKVYMQREMAKAINCMTQQQKIFAERICELQSQATARVAERVDEMQAEAMARKVERVNELQSQATASCPTDQDSLQTTEPKQGESLR